MNKVHVEKESKGRFNLLWEDFPDEELSLDFNPLLQEFDIAAGVILHWQARPKSTKFKKGRCWGIYDVSADIYLAGIASDIPTFKTGRVQVLDIPEYKLSSVPTAVIYFPGLKARESNGMIIIS